MTRRNFFNFVAGFFAGSLLPWPRRKREPQLPAIWASDKISVVSTPVNEAVWATNYRHKTYAMGVQITQSAMEDDLYGYFEAAAKRARQTAAWRGEIG